MSGKQMEGDIRKGKQPMLGENTPKVRPRSRGGNVHRS
jgi:hypothetical protein